MDQLLRPSLEFQRVQHLAPPSQILPLAVSRTPKTNFLSMPLELRQMVYREVMQEDQEIFTKGIPAILRVNLQTTQEIYSHCTLITTLQAFRLCVHSSPNLTKIMAYQNITSNKRLRIILDWRAPSCPCSAFDWDRWLQENRLYIYDIFRSGFLLPISSLTISLGLCALQSPRFPVERMYYANERGHFRSFKQYYDIIEADSLQHRLWLSRFLKKMVEEQKKNVEIDILP